MIKTNLEYDKLIARLDKEHLMYMIKSIQGEDFDLVIGSCPQGIVGDRQFSKSYTLFLNRLEPIVHIRGGKIKKVITGRYSMGRVKNPELSADLVWCAIKGVIEKRLMKEGEECGCLYGR